MHDAYALQSDLVAGIKFVNQPECKHLSKLAVYTLDWQGYTWDINNWQPLNSTTACA